MTSSSLRVGDHVSWFRFGAHQRTYGTVVGLTEGNIKVVAGDSDRVVELPIGHVQFYSRAGATK